MLYEYSGTSSGQSMVIDNTMIEKYISDYTGCCNLVRGKIISVKKLCRDTEKLICWPAQLRP